MPPRDGISGLGDIAFTDERHGFAVGAATQAYPSANVLLATSDGGAACTR